MKYLSTFSGIGGFELGIQQAYDNRQKTNNKGGSSEVLPELVSSPERNDVERPLSCIGYSEIDKYASAIYQRHFPNHKNYGDITTIDETKLPDFDLMVGGFPCQSFSIAGKRGGFDDTRGTMFFEIARIVREKQPRLLLLENVKGLLSHDKGKTFTTIISTLDELGYDCQWQVLNSKNHGVPQNRERVFIIGHLRGTSRPEVFPFGEGSELNNGKAPQGNDLAYCLQAGNDKHRGSYIKQLNQPTHSNDRVYGTDGLSPTLNTMQGGNRQPFIAEKDLMIRDGRDNRSCLRAGRTPELGIAGASIRRLTPTECERLQGFPDGWTEGVSDTQRYKCCGNAVTTNVIKDIMVHLL